MVTYPNEEIITIRSDSAIGEIQINYMDTIEEVMNKFENIGLNTLLTYPHDNQDACIRITANVSQDVMEDLNKKYTVKAVRNTPSLILKGPSYAISNANMYPPAELKDYYAYQVNFF